MKSCYNKGMIDSNYIVLTRNSHCSHKRVEKKMEVNGFKGFNLPFDKMCLYWNARKY